MYITSCQRSSFFSVGGTQDRECSWAGRLQPNISLQPSITKSLLEAGSWQLLMQMEKLQLTKTGHCFLLEIYKKTLVGVFSFLWEISLFPWTYRKRRKNNKEWQKSPRRCDSPHNCQGDPSPVLWLCLFTSLCSDEVLLAHLPAVATDSHILRLFLCPSYFRAKHFPAYWSGDRGKLGQEKVQRLQAVLATRADQMLGVALDWGRGIHPREKEIMMGLVNIRVQDFSKQFWKQRMVKHRDEAKETQVAPFQLLFLLTPPRLVKSNV